MNLISDYKLGPYPRKDSTLMVGFHMTGTKIFLSLNFVDFYVDAITTYFLQKLFKPRCVVIKMYSQSSVVNPVNYFVLSFIAEHPDK